MDYSFYRLSHMHVRWNITSFSFIETQKQDYGLPEFLQLNQKFSTSNTNISTQKSNAYSNVSEVNFCLFVYISMSPYMSQELQYLSQK